MSNALDLAGERAVTLADAVQRLATRFFTEHPTMSTDAARSFAFDYSLGVVALSLSDDQVDEIARRILHRAAIA